MRHKSRVDSSLSLPVEFGPFYNKTPRTVMCGNGCPSSGGVEFSGKTLHVYLRGVDFRGMK